ncbi:hypothetical protein [Paenarthrobacter sp. NEAU-H11]|uniref:hypothetical protein n=1 Tax=Paenarthrobacter sp. NEAU-H11 TaxID=3423924 RepID=UPI003D33234E
MQEQQTPVAQGASAAAVSTDFIRTSRKWIRKRIEQLDPYVDYQEIWALSYIYNVTDFDLHWQYTVDNSHLGMTTWGADAAYRDGTGAMIVQAEQRTTNTNDHMLLWAEHGPDSPVTKQAIDIVNKQHVKWAKHYKGSFSHSEDYIFLFSAAATAEHTLKRSLGLPGWSEKQKIAAHRFWCGIAELFTVESGEVLTDVEPMPKTFEECAAYAQAYSERPWPENPIGAPFTEELIKQFLEAWFPQQALRPFGRALITTFFAPSLFRIYGMKQPHWALQSLARGFVRARFIYRDYIRADEKEPITERHRRLVAKGRATASRIDTTVHRAVGKQNPGGGCPHARIN